MEKTVKGNFIDSIGIVSNVKGNKYKIKYNNGQNVGIFTNESFSPMKVKNIIGFENNPPWFVKKSSIQSALDYLKSSEFKQLPNSKKNLVLLKILKNLIYLVIN